MLGTNRCIFSSWLENFGRGLSSVSALRCLVTWLYELWYRSLIIEYEFHWNLASRVYSLNINIFNAKDVTCSMGRFHALQWLCKQHDSWRICIPHPQLDILASQDMERRIYSLWPRIISDIIHDAIVFHLHICSTTYGSTLRLKELVVLRYKWAIPLNFTILVNV